jgi:hypothetical protein
MFRFDFSSNKNIIKKKLIIFLFELKSKRNMTSRGFFFSAQKPRDVMFRFDFSSIIVLQLMLGFQKFVNT